MRGQFVLSSKTFLHTPPVNNIKLLLYLSLLSAAVGGSFMKDTAVVDFVYAEHRKKKRQLRIWRDQVIQSVSRKYQK